MNVLLLAQWYEPVIGGEEIHVRTLAHELAGRGHRVTVAAIAHPERPDRYWDGPVRVHRLRGSLQRVPFLFSDGARQSLPPFPDPGIASGLRDLVRRERPDIVHAHNWIVYSYLPVKARSVPLVLTLHDYSLTCATKVRLYRGSACSGPAAAKCLRCTSDHYGAMKGPITLGALWGMHPAVRAAVDCVVSVSGAVERDNAVPRHARRHVVIPNFIDGAFESSTADVPPGLLPAEPYIMYAGSLSRIKGIEPLLAAYAGLDPASRPPLVLVGYRGLERIAALDRLPAGARLITDVPRATVAAAWRRSLFAVVPSVCPEAFGLVALEAMLFGRPAIVSDIGGLRELVTDDVSGLVVRPGDVADLRAALDRLATDSALRDQLGAGARTAATRFRAERVIPAIESLYESLRR